MKVLMRFLDWSSGAVNVLKWYKQVIEAYAKPDEAPLQTEQRLYELYGKSESADCDKPLSDTIGEISEEITEFLPVFYRAWHKLDERERCLLREFYLEKNEEGTLDAIMRISSILGYERSRIYTLKKQALTKFSFYLFKHI